MPWRPRPACVSGRGRCAARCCGWGRRAKKRTLRAAELERDDIVEARQDWQATAAALDPERLVFVDESAALTNLVRLYARSPKGRRAYGTVPCGRWERLTVLGALGHEGLIGAMSIEAATTGVVFHAFLERVLLPEPRRIRPDAVIVMDDLAAHKTAAVRGLLDGSGFAYHHLPSHSPDLNPIEPAWAKMKIQLRKAAARTTEALHEALGPALDAISAADARGFFRHAGYGINSQPAGNPL